MSIKSNRLVRLTSRRKMPEKIFDELNRLLGSRRKGLLFEDNLLGFYAESLEGSIFITEQLTPPDCRTCGACCTYFHQILISVADSTPRSLAWTVVDGDDQVTYWLKREAREGRCVALAGTIGERADCLIYELRPTACRAFEAGSDRCHALRRMYGLEPGLSAPERDHHMQTLKGHQADEELDLKMPDAPPDDEDAQINFLQELIAYNFEKLEAIIEEMTRLKDLFKASCAIQAQENCQHVLEVADQAKHSFVDAMFEANFNQDLEGLSEAERNEFLNQLLMRGRTSQEILATATGQLKELSELAFEVLGMSSKFHSR